MESAFRNIEDVNANAALYQDKEVADHLRDNEQRFCLMSFVAGEGTAQKYEGGMAMRVYGCRANRASANKWARKLPAVTGHFDVFSVSTNEWVALPPRLEEDGEPNEVRVETIMARFKEREAARKTELEARLDRETRQPRPLLPAPEGGAEGGQVPFVDAGAVSAPKAAAEDDDAEGEGDDDDDDDAEDTNVPHSLRDPSQQWCVLSIVDPDYGEGEKQQLALRIFGCRESAAEAEEWARQLRDDNPYFSVFTLKCNEFAKMPPDLRSIGTMHSNEKVVQQLHDAYTAEHRARRENEAKQLEQMHEPAAPAPAPQQEQEQEQEQDLKQLREKQE